MNAAPTTKSHSRPLAAHPVTIGTNDDKSTFFLVPRGMRIEVCLNREAKNVPTISARLKGRLIVVGIEATQKRLLIADPGSVRYRGRWLTISPLRLEIGERDLEELLKLVPQH